MANKSLRNFLIASGIGAALVGGGYLMVNRPLAEKTPSKIVYDMSIEDKQKFIALRKVEQGYNSYLLAICEKHGLYSSDFIMVPPFCLFDAIKVKTGAEETTYRLKKKLPTQEEVIACLRDFYIKNINAGINRLNQNDSRLGPLKNSLDDLLSQETFKQETLINIKSAFAN
ncbi:hypothetical protein HYV88_00010 [Candidatus Woesearchaeota archaeon]|nr:hypothetical protein [Candidatus Woesearchaeota archaeon]